MVPEIEERVKKSIVNGIISTAFNGIFNMEEKKEFKETSKIDKIMFIRRGSWKENLINDFIFSLSLSHWYSGKSFQIAAFKPNKERVERKVAKFMLVETIPYSSGNSVLPATIQ